MLGLSGRTRRLPFAAVMIPCFFGSAILLSTKPLIAKLADMEPGTAILVGNIMAVAAVIWTFGAACAWLIFSVRRLRDAGWHPALAMISVVLGFVNDPGTLIDPAHWADKPFGIGLTALCIGWLVTLIALPSSAAPETVVFRQTPDPRSPRNQFGLR